MTKRSLLRPRSSRRASYVLDADPATAWAALNDDEVVRAADPRQTHVMTIAGEPLTVGHLATTIFDFGDHRLATTLEVVEVEPGARLLTRSLDQFPSETETVYSPAPRGRTQLDVRISVLVPGGWEPVTRWRNGRILRHALVDFEDVLKRLFPGT